MSKKDKDLVTISRGLSVPKDLMDFYKDNAGLGSENLSGALPQLKITESNSHNELASGQNAEAGTFYHSPTKESFKTVRVSIMAISKGFYGIQKNEDGSLPRKKNGDIDTKFTQLVGGMIIESSQPFIMFSNGTRLNNMWNFGKEIKPFTKQVPMFSFEVELGLEEMKSGNRSWHVVTYKIIRDKEDQIELISDRELLSMLKEGIEPMKETFEGFISSNEVDRYTGLPISNYSETVEDAREILVDDDLEPVKEPTNEELDTTVGTDGVEDDVPF